MVAYNSELRADQIEIFLGTRGPIPLSNLRSFFYQLERVTTRGEYFDGTVQLALSEARPGSLGLILDVQKRFRSRAVVLGRAARALLADQQLTDRELEERMAAAAERSAAAAERSASAGERTAKLTEFLLYATVAAVLVPVIAQEIRGGDLAAPIVKIDQHFDLSGIRVESASNGKWIPDDELPDERVLSEIKAANQTGRRELLALRELEDIDYLIHSQGHANLVGQLRLVRGRVHMKTHHGNEFEIEVDPSRVPLGIDVFVVIERGRGDSFRASSIEKIDPL